MEGLPTPLKRVCQQMGTAEQVNVTFDDLAGCDSVLLVQYLLKNQDKTYVLITHHVLTYI